MQVVVEFSGISRIVTKERQITLDLPDGTSFQDLVEVLSFRYPGLVGQVIDPADRTLYASNLFNLNGKHMIRPDAMVGEGPQDGDRLMLMSVLAGG